MGVLDDLGMSTQALREEVSEVDPPRGLRRAPERAGGGSVDPFPWRHEMGMSEEEAVEAVASGRFRPSGGGSPAALEAARRFREEADALLVEADRSGSLWPAAHGDQLMDLAEDLVREATAGRARPRPSGAFAEFLGIA